MIEHSSKKDYHLLVFTDLDGTLLDHETYSFELALPAIDVLKEKNIPLIFCTSKTRAEIERIVSGIGKRGHSRVVVAGSSERLFGRLYRDALAGAGIDPAMVEFANIHEHSLLAHRGSKRDATSSALTLIDVAVARVTHAAAMSKLETDIKPLCVVIGGGISGMSAAMALATRGVKVTIVDKEDKVGGLLNKLKAYRLQDLGLDTVEANHYLGFPAEARDYVVAKEIIELLGIRSIAVLRSANSGRKRLTPWSMPTKSIPETRLLSRC